jgi:RNA recognition motif-containing protein
MASYSMSPYEQPPSSGDGGFGNQSNGAGAGGKIFVGGLSPSVTSEGLIAHFSAYGEVLDATIMNDKITGRPRGFGFVTFRNPEAVDALMKDNHVLDGKQVECKRAVPMGYMDKPGGAPAPGPSGPGGPMGPRPISPPSAGPAGGGGQPLSGRCNPEKIFVGGLPASCDDNKLREYFSKYGVIIDAVVMIDRDLQRHRGFGYVLFQDAGAVDGAVADHDKHQIDGKWVDVKRCIVQENSGQWPGGGAQSGPMRKGYGKGGAMMAPMPGVSATMPGYYGGAPAGRPTGYGGADYGTSSYYGGATAAGAYGKPQQPTAAAAYAARGMGPAGKGAAGAAPAGAYGMGGYMTSAYGAPPQATSAYGYGPADPYATSGYGTSAYGAMPGYGASSAYGGYGTSAYGSAPAPSAYGTYGAPAPGAQPQSGAMQPPTSSGAANPNDLYAASRRSGYRTSPY